MSACVTRGSDQKELGPKFSFKGVLLRVQCKKMKRKLCVFVLGFLPCLKSRFTKFLTMFSSMVSLGAVTKHTCVRGHHTCIYTHWHENRAMQQNIYGHSMCLHGKHKKTFGNIPRPIM